MKNFCFFVFVALCALTTSCTLDKEPEIPTDANNENAPNFLSADLTAITHDSIRAKARLSTRGNLNILHYGWVWSENPNPTLQDIKQESGALGIDSFETLIPGLTLGKTYHFRPYVITGSGETYGPEKTIFMGIPQLNNVAVVADSACFLRVQCSVQSPAPPIEYGILYLIGAGNPRLQQQSVPLPGTGLNNGIFQTDLTMLTPNTTYSIQSYAKSASGTGYSSVLSITTPSSTLAANFSLDSVDDELFQGAIVHFINSSIGATAYTWSFGDGATSPEDSPVHTFNTQGNMTVRLTAENGGCRLTKDTLLKIIENPFQGYWVEVEGGTFIMGCTPEQVPCESHEYPDHQVTLSSFFIGKTEVTQEQWQAITGNNPSFFDNLGSDYPVESVSWDRIVNEFIPALDRKTGRKHGLPTEAEWEFAARGGNLSQGYKFAGSNNMDDVGWYFTPTSLFNTHQVGELMPNELGLYDMSGNVVEWCSDWFGSYPSPGPLDGSFRVLRGGSWFSLAKDCRTARRSSYVPGNRASHIGFRLVFVP